MQIKEKDISWYKEKTVTQGAGRQTGLQMNYAVQSRSFQKIAALFMSAAVIFVLLFSVFYLAEETEHDCVGEDCPICDCLAWCGHFQHQLFGGVEIKSLNSRF